MTLYFVSLTACEILSGYFFLLDGEFPSAVPQQLFQLVRLFRSNGYSHS